MPIAERRRASNSVALQAGGVILQDRERCFLIAAPEKFLDVLLEVARRNAPCVRRSEHGALAAFRHRGPELPVEQLRGRFDDHSRVRQFLLVPAQDFSQAFDFLGHFFKHLAHGVDLHFAALVSLQGELDRQMLRETQQHRVFRIRRGRLRRHGGQRLPQHLLRFRRELG